jgi:hypothetical protein
MCKTQEQMLNKLVVIKNNVPIGLSVNLKKCGINLSFNVSKIQTCKGFTSKLSNNNHVLFLDYDKDNGKDIFEFREKLRVIQKKYSLSNIYFFSDSEGSYRVWCFSEISFKVYTKILLELFDYLDSLFINYTIRNEKSTIRISDKIGREPQKLIDSLTLVTYFVPIPIEMMQEATYDTLLNKKGVKIQLGDNGKISWR